MKRNSNRTIKKRMLALLLCATMTLNGGLSVLAEEIQSTAAETMATEETEAIEPVMISEEPTSQAETETKQETKQETETETKQETKQETETETKQETKQETETETKQETKQETETETETESETETETETEAETEAREFKYEDAAVEIKVVAKEGTSIPKGASLKVTPINKEEITDDMSDSKKKEVREINDQYDSTEELLKEKVASDSGNVLKGFLAYDIKFVDTNGKEVEPDGNVEVSIQYKSASIPDEVDAGSDADITVMHLTENKAGKVLKIIDMKKEKLLKDINITNSKKIKKAKFITDSFSVYAIVWTAAEAVVRTLKVDVVDMEGNPIPGVEDMTLEIQADGTVIQPSNFKNVIATDESRIEYEPDRIQLVNASGTAIDTLIYGVSCNSEGNIQYQSSDNGTWEDLGADRSIRLVYEKAIKTVSNYHEVVFVDGNTIVKKEKVDVTLRNNEIVNFNEGECNLFADSTTSSVTWNNQKLGETVVIDGVPYVYKRAVISASENYDFNENDGASKLLKLKLENETVKYTTAATDNGDIKTYTVVFIYCKADVTELRITAKFANADSTGTFVLEDVEIPVTKNAGELATAEDQYQKFADFSKSGSKNQITIDDAIYRFEGAYVTTNEMYGQDPSTEKKIDALRIFGNEIQFRTEGTTTWTDIKETSTYNLFLVYKEQSKTITLTAVLADASKKDLDEIKVTLTREQLEDGTLAVESPVKLISSLVAYNQEPSSDKPIPESYEINKKVYKFRNAVLIGNDLSSFTKVTYRDAYNKNAKKTTISATTNTVFVQGLKLNDTKIQYQPNDTQTFDIGARKIVLVYAEDLHTVPTIDSTSLGVTMRMINFRVRQTDFGGPYGDQVGRTPGLLTKTVKANGYPSTSDGKVDFETWFGENPTGDANLISSQPVNHLFLKSYFDSTGTFHFSGFENYAYLNQDTGNFTVYKEIGATDATNKNTYKRGNFFPFNNIAPGVYSPYVNTFDSSGAVLPNTNPRKNENLYTGITDEDYNFGMYLETKFAQPMDGYYRGQPMRFEFNGDDDFWVYIDGVLVLDIGGIHNAQDGYIDFSTGRVYVKPLSQSGAENWEDTTIKAKFIEALGADGIDEYMFEGNTFADATIHTMQIFYMERGEGASTLHLNFNLPTIPASALQVEKQLGDTEQEIYTDEKFAFRVYAQPISRYEPQLDEYGNKVQVEVYKENAAKNEYVLLAEESGAYIGNSDSKIKFEKDGTFYLKAGETAIFPEIQANRKYYVEEINLNSERWDVSKTKYTEDGADTMLPETSIGDSATELETDIRKLSERKKVTFYNYIKKPGNIQIEKKIVNGNQNPDYGFDFKVTVKHAVSGTMVPYAGEYYYLKDKNTGQYIDRDGNLQEPGATPTAYDRIGNGVIKDVKVGQVVELRGFYQGTEFAVEEVNLKNIYETPVITYDGEENHSVYQVKADSKVSVVVTNKEKYQYDWTFYKQSKSDSNKLLEGAEFELSSQSKTYYGKSIKDNSKTDVNEAGMIVWYEGGSKVEKIAPGTYQFKETKAPTGYTLSEEVWTVVFKDEASPIVYRDENQNGIPEESELIDNHRKDKIDETGMHHVITSFYFENEMLYELPTTGGPGIYWYMISGVALMMGATLTVYKKRREEVLR